MRAIFTELLPTPDEVKEEYPVTDELARRIGEERAAICNAFAGKDSRLVLIIGPCSADYEDSVMEYMFRLASIRERVDEKLIIVPRIYTNKPRTTGIGYKGLVHQPNPMGSPSTIEGIIATRKLHFRAVSEAGFVCADELLYPQNYLYLDDVLGYVAIGARSVEDQEHRLISSAVDVPVGMKNPTSGDLNVMMNAIVAAQSEQDFIYRGWSCKSEGNTLCHAILRGFTNDAGTSFPNYDFETVSLLKSLYDKNGDIANPGVVIDCNHANSGKRPNEQPRIVREVMEYGNYDDGLREFIKGFMVESYLVDGAQSPAEGTYGKSITDACIGWERTERLIFELAEMV